MSRTSRRYRIGNVDPSAIGAGALVVVVLVCAGNMVADIAGTPDGAMGAGFGLAACAVGGLVVFGIALRWLGSRLPGGGGRERILRVHHDGGGDVATAVRHEAAHGDMAQHYGARVHAMVVHRSDASGYTDYSWPGGGGDALAEAAISYAGSAGSGDPWHGRHCAADRRAFGQDARTAWARRTAMRIARNRVAPGLFGQRAGVRRMARRVQVR